MDDENTLFNVEMHITSGCLIVPIQIELYDEAMLHIQREILKRIEATGVKSVVIDFSGVTVMDSFLCKTAFDTARMASLLGAKTVITGFRPEVVASIVNLGIDFEGILISTTVEEGIHKVAPATEIAENFDELPEDDFEEKQEGEPDSGEEVSGKED
ncbi:MAG: STAS domain-containing protein [Candidatus Methanofastidiosia archaeon]